MTNNSDISKAAKDAKQRRTQLHNELSELFGELVHALLQLPQSGLGLGQGDPESLQPVLADIALFIEVL